MYLIQSSRKLYIWKFGKQDQRDRYIGLYYDGDEVSLYEIIGDPSEQGIDVNDFTLENDNYDEFRRRNVRVKINDIRKVYSSYSVTYSDRVKNILFAFEKNNKEIIIYHEFKPVHINGISRVVDLFSNNYIYYIIFENTVGEYEIYLNGVVETSRMVSAPLVYVDKDVWWYMYRTIDGMPGRGDIGVNLGKGSMIIRIALSNIQDVDSPVFAPNSEFAFRIRIVDSGWAVMRGNVLKQNYVLVTREGGFADAVVKQVNCKENDSKSIIFYKYNVADGFEGFDLLDPITENWLEFEAERVYLDTLDVYKCRYIAMKYSDGGKYGIYTNIGSLEPKYDDILEFKIVDRFVFYIYRKGSYIRPGYVYFGEKERKLFDEFYKDLSKDEWDQGPNKRDLYFLEVDSEVYTVTYNSPKGSISYMFDPGDGNLSRR